MIDDKHKVLEAGLKGGELSLNGIIVPGDMDERLVMVSIILSTDVELDLVIEREAKSDELFDHLRERVNVKGFIGEDEKGRKTIRLTDFEILETRESKAAKTE